MQNLVRRKTIGVTGNGGRGTAGAGPGRDLLYNNTQINTMFDSTILPPQPSGTTYQTWSWALKETIWELPGQICLRAAWIKGHAGFPDNEYSDSYSKWIAYVTEWDASLLFPHPPRGTIFQGRPSYSKQGYPLPPPQTLPPPHTL